MNDLIERLVDFPGGEATVRVNPFTGGVVVEFDGIQIHHMAGYPTDAEICAAIVGYKAGVNAGKHLGRSILQNDIKNLLDLR